MFNLHFKRLLSCQSTNLPVNPFSQANLAKLLVCHLKMQFHPLIKTFKSKLKINFKIKIIQNF